MAEENKKDTVEPKAGEAEKNNPKDSGEKKGPANAAGKKSKSVYAERRNVRRKRAGGARDKVRDEFDQRILDLARVTRVMAGGKRMRFRACVVIGNKKGKVAIGLSKGADVTIAVTKAVTQAKKEIIEVPIVNETIPHEIYHKKGAAKVLLKPAKRGRGVIAGGAIRVIMEFAGVKNITSKNLGTNNKVNIAKCTIEALNSLKRVEKTKEKPKNVKPQKEKADFKKTDSKKPKETK